MGAIRRPSIRRMIRSSASSSPSAAASPETARFIFAERRPLWLECASSMTIAKRRSRNAVPISSWMNGNFSIVVTTIFRPVRSHSASDPESSACATTRSSCANCRIVSRICRSRFTRSVTTTTWSTAGSVPPGAAGATRSSPTS